MLQYFKPDNWISLVIIIVIWAALFLWWRAMRRASDHFQASIAAIKYFNETVGDFAGLHDSLRMGGVRGNPRELFRQCVRKDVAGESLVVPHVESIFVAGCYQGHLNVGELLRHSERTILDGESVRKARLSLFLILGLLGTLFGLADSIVALLTLMKGNADAAASMTELLAGLRGAFSPSLSGVMATVLGTYLYSHYQQTVIFPLLTYFRASTLHHWVPRLYPTTQQIAIEAAQKMMAETKVVAEFAASIQRDSGELQSNLKSAALFTNRFQKGMEQLSTVVGDSALKTEQMLNHMAVQLERFGEASDRWASFETQLVRFYSSIELAQGRMVDNSVSLKELVAQQTANIDKLAQAVQESSIGALNEVRASMTELSRRMTALHAPFKDAAEQMIDSSRILLMNADASNERLRVIAEEMARRGAEMASAMNSAPGGPPSLNNVAGGTGEIVLAIEKLARIVSEERSRADWRFWRRKQKTGDGEKL